MHLAERVSLSYRRLWNGSALRYDKTHFLIIFWFKGELLFYFSRLCRVLSWRVSINKLTRAILARSCTTATFQSPHSNLVFMFLARFAHKRQSMNLMSSCSNFKINMKTSSRMACNILPWWLRGGLIYGKVEHYICRSTKWFKLSHFYFGGKQRSLERSRFQQAPYSPTLERSLEAHMTNLLHI